MERNSELRNRAMDALAGNWGLAALITLVFFILTGTPTGASRYVFSGIGIVSLLLIPIYYGYSILFLERVRGAELDFSKLFDGFKDFGRIFGTSLLTGIYTLLWALLLIVPGIIKSYSYALTSYVLKDHPELSYNRAIEKSMAMMDGYKMKLFLMDLSFIGWAILCCFTLGIGFLFLAPYVEASHAAFYENLVADYAEDRD